jgi:hypothetical protein
MRRRWLIGAALGLGLPLLGVFATGCREREVTYYRGYPGHGVYVERGYGYYPHGYYPYGYYPYGYYGGRHFRHEREHAFREREHAFRGRERHFRGEREHHEREHAFRHERERGERHG